MTKILISINPEYVDGILRGIKKFEYRTKVAKDVGEILIYCTNPTKKVVGQAKIKNVVCDTPQNLWNKTKKYSGVKKIFFDKYFKGRKKAYAYELEEIVKYDIPKSLSDYGIKYAPQSYVYIK